MRRQTPLLAVPRCTKAFTLLDLLVVIAITAMLAALLLPILSRAKASSKQTVCLNNLMQIAKGAHMYADGFNEILFPVNNSSNYPEHGMGPGVAYYEWTAYDSFMRSYAGLKGAPSPHDQLFACPADTFYYWEYNWEPDARNELIPQSQHLQANTSYSSYAFNAGNAAIPRDPRFPGMCPGIMGSKLSSVELPAKTVLIAEFPALDSYSWHQPSPSWQRYYNNARNMISFVDGHASYVKMYYGSDNPSQSLQRPLAFNPPAGYDYKWSRD